MKTKQFIIILFAVGLTITIITSFILLKQKGVANTTDIVIKGSDSEFNLIMLLSTEYKKAHPDAIFDITGGGSAKGVQALLKNETHIANASRSLTDEEISEVDTNKFGIRSFIIAGDAVAIITHRQVGVDSLSLDQLKSIFRGDIKNWKDVGGVNAPIVIYGRDDNSGTYHYMLRRLLLETFPTGVSKFAHNYQIIEKVESEEGAIGYVSTGAIIDRKGKPYSRIWPVSISIEGGRACSPFDIQSIKYGEYPLTRALYQYVRKDAEPKILDFIKFELEPKQQLALEKHGYFPVSPIQEQINKKNGIDVLP
jgi:phosphate transport system substrate-binding protein